MAAENDVDLGSGRARGRHRGERHDRIGSAVTATWALGHVLALFLLGVTVTQHGELEDLMSSLVDRSVPDQETTG
ncbi:hypothetical protein [Streptomyces sp. CC77]|uniref:hypothetical protein n=1 Tax=Streptomyces sp. CC77 TaxID=1906739 RepID=UPI0008DC6418|nr:hypothetical protein [Streptomyces sp. CC77]OII59712.1 hypothetical protein BJP39_11775 [Streptomyces sp. CC77]